MPASHDLTPAFRHAQRVLSDPDEFGDAVSGVSLAVDFLRRYTAPARIEQFQSRSWALDVGETHMKARVQGTVPYGWASLCFVRGGNSLWRGLPGGPGMLFCTPPGEELDGRITPGFEYATIALPPDIWERCRVLAGAQDARLRHFSGWQLPPASCSPIGRQLDETKRLLRASIVAPHLAERAARAAADWVTLIASTAWESAVGDSPSRLSTWNRARLARRADAWMRDHLSEQMRVPDVCLALHVSRRELEYAFRATFDQSPRDHLQALRLNAIRRALRRRESGDDSVIRAAFDHGITHLGRFAAQYHALFGEKPSATLRR